MATPSTPSPDVAVIGGGLIGLSVAWRALSRGLRVTVLERAEPAGATSRVAAGMLAPVSEAAFGEDALLALNRASASRYGSWLAEIASASGRDPGHRACGTLLVARDSDQAAALEREAAFREELGLPVERLRPSAARRLEPALAPALRAALHVPGDHAVDPRRLAGALLEAIERTGGAVRAHTPVEALRVDGGRVTGARLAGGEVLEAGAVVVAAGCWSAGLAGLPEEAAVPLRPVKGQLLRLRDPAGPGLLERVVRTEDAYLVPRADGGYVLGATVEERGWDTTVTAGAMHELLREAVAVVPGVAELELEEARAGLRPCTPDNAPAIGPGALAGLHWATGHHRHGVLLAPVTADLVVAGLAGEPPGALGEPFAPLRFAARVPA